MALTRITKGVIKPNENYDTHNINSTGIITAVGANFSGNVSVGGTLTYEDVTSIDSVGVITARDGIDCNGDLDVDGHTNLDNVSIAGVTTTTENFRIKGDIKYLTVGASDDLSLVHDGSHSRIKNTTGTLFLQSDGIKLKNNASTEHYISCVDGGAVELYHNGTKRLETSSVGVSIPQDLDVDGHTNLDNVNIAGISTFTGVINSTVSTGTAPFVVASTTKVTNLNADLLDGKSTANSNVGNSIVVRNAAGGFVAGDVTFGNIVGTALSVSGITTISNDLHIESTQPRIYLTDTNHNSDWYIGNSDGTIIFYDTTLTNTRFEIYPGNSPTTRPFIRTPFTTDCRFDGFVRIGAVGTSPNHSLTVGGNSNFSGISTFLDIDVDGHTNLDNVSIAGVATVSGTVTTGDLTISDNNPTITFNEGDGNPDYRFIGNNGTLAIQDIQDSYAQRFTILSNGNINIQKDLDVDGHTNLDNVSIVGVATITGDITVTNTNPKIQLVDSNSNPDWQFHNDNGILRIDDTTANSTRLRIDSSGTVLIPQNLDVGAGIDVTGAITADDLRTDNSQTFYLTTANDFRFRNTGGTERLRITSSGRVNIGGNYTQNNDQLHIIANTGKNAIGFGATTQGMRLGWDGDNSAYDHVRIFHVDYNSAGTYGIASNNPTTAIQSDSVPGSGTVNSTFWFRRNNSGNYAGRNIMNVCVDGDLTIGGAGELNGASIPGVQGSKQGGFGVSKLTIQPDDRTTAFNASNGDTWHDVIIKQRGGATNNAAGIAFQVADDSYHKNAGTGICAVKNGTNSDYGSDLVFITRPQNAVAEERLRITANGMIGINKTTPLYMLDIEKSDSGGSSKQLIQRWMQGGQNTLELHMYGGSIDQTQFAAVNGEQTLSFLTGVDSGNVDSTETTLLMTQNRDLWNQGPSSGTRGGGLFIGRSASPYGNLCAVRDSHRRPVVYMAGNYPEINLVHEVPTNTSHGGTIRFATYIQSTNAATGKQFVIGTNGSGTFLDIGYASAGTGVNVHNGINNHSGTTLFRVDSANNTVKIAGHIIQVGYARHDPNADTYTSISSDTKARSNVYLDFTPKYANSKLLIITRMHTRMIAANGCSYGIDVSTNSGSSWSVVSGMYQRNALDFFYKGDSVNHHYTGFCHIQVDASNINSRRYSPWGQGWGGGTWELSYGHGEHSVTVYEIATTI